MQAARESGEGEALVMALSPICPHGFDGLPDPRAPVRIRSVWRECMTTWHTWKARAAQRVSACRKEVRSVRSCVLSYGGVLTRSEHATKATLNACMCRPRELIIDARCRFAAQALVQRMANTQHQQHRWWRG